MRQAGREGGREGRRDLDLDLDRGCTLLAYPPLPCACTALSKHGVGVEPPF